MRSSRTLAFHLAREIVQYALLGFAAISVVLISQNLLRRLDDLTAVGFTAADFAVVLRCLLPMLTAYSIPVALLFGALLAIRRQVSDSEVLAMRACGLGSWTLLLPTLAIGALVSALSAWLLIGVEHGARRDLLALFNSVAARGSILEAGKFRAYGDRVFFVSERDRENRLQGIMIADETRDRPYVIFAERGRLSLDRETARIHLELDQGQLHLQGGDTPGTEPGEGSDANPNASQYERIFFDSFDYHFDVSSLLSGDASPVRPKQMTLGELRAVLARVRSGDALGELHQRDPLAYELEIQRRFGLPAAAFVLAFAAVPIALAGKPQARSWGPIGGAVLAFAYYAALSLCEFLTHEGWIPAALAFWIPNLGVAALSIGLLLRQARGGST